jgi:hypothetical protein
MQQDAEIQYHVSLIWKINLVIGPEALRKSTKEFDQDIQFSGKEPKRLLREYK